MLVGIWVKCQPLQAVELEARPCLAFEVISWSVSSRELQRFVELRRHRVMLLGLSGLTLALVEQALVLFEPVFRSGAHLRKESPSGIAGCEGPIHLPPVHSKHSLGSLASNSSPAQRQSCVSCFCYLFIALPIPSVFLFSFLPFLFPPSPSSPSFPVSD